MSVSLGVGGRGLPYMVRSGCSVDRQGDLKLDIFPYCACLCLEQYAFGHVVLLREVGHCVGARRIAEIEARIQGGSRMMVRIYVSSLIHISLQYYL